MVEVYRSGDRVLSIKMVVEDDTINIISAYAPQIGEELFIKEQFWDELEKMIKRIPNTEKIFIGGDLNGHVGKDAGQYTQVHGGFGFGTMNNEGHSIIVFSMANNLKIVNTCFEKQEEHLNTYKSGGNRSQIDFFLVRNSDRRMCINCKVIPGDGVTTQHRPLVLDVRVKFNHV